MKLNFEESEIFNSLFDQENNQITIEKKNPKNSIIRAINEAIENTNDSDLVFHLSSLLEKLSSLDDDKLELLISSLPIDEDTNL